jgi:DNA-binding HxlR family transcriptional regulator
MARRHYGQSCSVASALDRIGERWSLLIVRELLLGPLRFSELARGVGGAPTDILTRRLRDLEADGIVRRRELGPPVPATVYELTELGHQLEGTIVELGRWGLNFYALEDLPGIEASWLPGALRVILRPPPESNLNVQLRSEGHSFRLRIEGETLVAERGEATDPDLTLSGPAPDAIKLLVAGEAAAPEVEVEGDRAALEALRAMVVLPEQLRAEALAEVGVPA